MNNAIAVPLLFAAIIGGVLAFGVLNSPVIHTRGGKTLFFIGVVLCVISAGAANRVLQA